jgi:hypothetical protein
MATQPTPNRDRDRDDDLRRGGTRGEGRVGVYDQDDTRTTGDPLARDPNVTGGPGYTEPADAYVNEPRRDLTDPAAPTDPARTTAPRGGSPLITWLTIAIVAIIVLWLIFTFVV